MTFGWSIENQTNGALDDYFDSQTGDMVAAPPGNLTLVIPIVVGHNLINLSGRMDLASLGRTAVGQLRFFNTSAVTGLGVLDASGRPLSATITAESGTVYPSLTTVPEPGALALAGLGLAVLILRAGR